MFLDVYRLIATLKGYELDNDINEIVKRLELNIDIKLEQMKRRRLYTVSKTAADPDEREKARIEYLDRVSMLEEFRYSKRITTRPRYFLVFSKYTYKLYNAKIET